MLTRISKPCKNCIGAVCLQLVSKQRWLLNKLDLNKKKKLTIRKYAAKIDSLNRLAIFLLSFPKRLICSHEVLHISLWKRHRTQNYISYGIQQLDLRFSEHTWKPLP